MTPAITKLSSSPSHPLCLSLLQKCTSMHHFLQIHAQMLRNRLSEDQFAVVELIDFCIAIPLGSIHYAHKLFAQIPNPNAFAWNTIIKGFANSFYPADSLHCFLRMLCSATRPNSYTFPYLLKACSRRLDLGAGEQLHCFMTKFGGDFDVSSVSGLTHMYGVCGRVESGCKVLVGRNGGDVVSWNCLLSGYVSCGQVDRARFLFDRMERRDLVSWNAMINGYAKSGKIVAARDLFDKMSERNTDTWNTMIAGYAACCELDIARELFDRMPVKNHTSWSVMVSAYAQGHCPSEALVLFNEMMKMNVMPNSAAVVSVLSVCSQVGSVETGRQVHAYLVSNKVKIDSVIGTSLIDMYSKCAYIDIAFRVFEDLVVKDVFSWTVIIGGLAANGYASKALELFAQMERDGVTPNEVTFVGVLCACSHSGLVELARQYFHSMRYKYGLEPSVEHYGCLVDALGRAGLLGEAVSLVQSMPKQDAVLWGTLLSACWIHKNVEIGELVADHLLELNPVDGGFYLLLSNIYAARGRWDDARRMRVLMKSKGLKKTPGCSSVEVYGVIHQF